MRALLGVALAAALWALPAAAFAGEAILADEQDDTLVFGLTATQLALAAAVGAGAGMAGALASGNVIAGAFGTLAAIYVAHLAAEAVLVGGVYYWWPWEAWPWEENPESAPASRTIASRRAARDRDAISIVPLRLSFQLPTSSRGR